MAINANNYNYVTGYIKCANVSTKYLPWGTTYASYGAWEVNFESIQVSGAGRIAESVDSDGDNWYIEIDSSGHPVVHYSRSSTNANNTKTFSSLTVSWNTWFSLRVYISTNASSPTLTCTVNGTSQSIQCSGRYHVNYTHDLQVGGSTSTLRGTTTVKGYAYGSNTLYTATFNIDSLSVGATSMTTDGYTFTISSAVKNYTLKYTVYYNANGGTSTPSSQTVTAGNSVTLASAISKSQTNTTAALTHTFNTNGGNTPSPTTKTTTKTTYSNWGFSKWALNGTGGTQYSAGASYTPTGTCTFYAIFTVNSTTYGYSTLGTLPTCTKNATTGTATRTVTYAPNGGSVSPTSATATAKITYSYTLAGWYTASSGGTAITTATAPTAGTNYYAHWNTSTSTGAYTTVTPPTPTRGNSTSTSALTFTFNSNGGNTPSPATKTTTKTTTTYYTFNKWWNGTTSYAAGTAFTPSGNITLTACWTTTTGTSYSTLGTLPTCTKNSTTGTATRTVTFAPNGGSVSPTSATATAQITYTYALNGWWTASSGGTQITTASNPSSGATYYAHWNTTTTTGNYGTVTPPTPTRANGTSTSALTFTFDSNGGNTPSATTKTTTKTTTTYYTFNKWWNGTTSYAAGTAFTPSSNITLTACWTTTTGTSYSALGALPTCTKNSTTGTLTYTITYNANGGSVSPSSATSTANTTATYSLKGWFTTTNGTTQVSSTSNPSTGTTYYAQWTTSTSGGTFTAVTLPTPTKNIHKVSGWYTASTGGTKAGNAGASYTPTGNITLYAQWTPGLYFKNNTTWTPATNAYIKVGDTWKTATAVWIKVSGTWTKL